MSCDCQFGEFSWLMLIAGSIGAMSSCATAARMEMKQAALEEREAARHAEIVVMERGSDPEPGPFIIRCGNCRTLARYPKSRAVPGADGGTLFSCPVCACAVAPSYGKP